eukprot:106302-Rhodomonas_salina.1
MGMVQRNGPRDRKGPHEANTFDMDRGTTSEGQAAPNRTEPSEILPTALPDVLLPLPVSRSLRWGLMQLDNFTCWRLNAPDTNLDLVGEYRSLVNSASGEGRRAKRR